MPEPPSSPTQVVEYQLAAREIVGQWFRLRMLRTRTVLLMSVLLCMGIFMVVSDRRSFLGWAFLAFPVLFPLSFYRLLWRSVRQHPEMTAPRSIAFDANGIVFMSSTTRNEYAWDRIRRFSATSNYYLLHLDNLGTAANIPKAAFTPEQREAFLSLARGKVDS
jgi:hypothetical protein